MDTSEKRRADDEIRRRNRELNALNAIATISTHRSISTKSNLTLRQVVTLFSSETGSDLSRDPGGQVLAGAQAGTPQRRPSALL